MNALPKLQNFGLPLLLKELLEQSSRRRTYLIRVAYAGLLFTFCLMFLLGRLPNGSSPQDRLGLGRMIYQDLIGWQFGGMYVFLPAIVCGAFTIEKEQNTLGLLFLTRLGPWTIVFEKLFSRMVPMSCLLLCSLPMVAFSYSLGGLEAGSLLIGIWLLVVTMFQLAAVSLASSAYCRTTSASLLSSYFAIGCLTFGLPLVDSLLLGSEISNGVRGSPDSLNHLILYPFAPFMHFHDLLEGSQADSIAAAILTGIPSLLMGFCFVILARTFVVRRAFAPPSNWVLKSLQHIDVLFHRLNLFAGRGIAVFSETTATPDTQPIAWRETHKRALGQFRYLIRIFLVLTIPAILISVAVIIKESLKLPYSQSSISGVVPCLWLVTTLLIAISSASLISGERSRQTLEVLLTTPLNGQQMILEKLAGIKRLIWVCSVPLLACMLLELYWRDSMRFLTYKLTAMGATGLEFYVWEYLAAALSMIWIYPRFTAWLALWIGLRTKSATRATLITLIVFVVLCLLPIILFIVIIEMQFRESYLWTRQSGIMMVLQFSPLGLLFQSEFGNLREFCQIPYVPILLNCLWYGTLWWLIRWHVLRSADKLLGRTASAG